MPKRAGQLTVESAEKSKRQIKICTWFTRISAASSFVRTELCTDLVFNFGTSFEVCIVVRHLMAQRRDSDRPNCIKIFFLSDLVLFHFFVLRAEKLQAPHASDPEIFISPLFAFNCFNKCWIYGSVKTAKTSQACSNSNRCNRLWFCFSFANRLSFPCLQTKELRIYIVCRLHRLFVHLFHLLDFSCDVDSLFVLLSHSFCRHLIEVDSVLRAKGPKTEKRKSLNA